MKKVILFGASILGEIAYQQLKDKYSILGFIDNDIKKIGAYFCNLEIYNINILRRVKDPFVIICSMYDLEITKQLLDYGIRRFEVFERSKDNFIIRSYDYSNIDNFTINPNKICLLIENHSGSSTLALSKDIKETIRNKYNIVTVFNSKKDHNYYYNLLTSNLIIHTHDFRCNDNQINIQLWHGVPIKGLSYMSNYANQNKEANHIAWSKLDYIVSYSQTYSTLLNSCYGVDGKKYKVLGMPRNDFLFNYNSCIDKLESIMKQNLEHKKIIFYLPTYRNTIFGEKNGQWNSNINFFSADQLKVFDEFLEENNILLVTKRHPQEEENIICSKNIFVLNENKLVEYNIDLYEILGCAKLLITDYSSVYFDYLLLDRPVIFYIPDFDIYKEDRGFLLEPFDFWAPGMKCKNIEDLKNAIKESLVSPEEFKEQRNLITSIIHQHQDDQSCKRVWKFIDGIISSEI